MATKEQLTTTVIPALTSRVTVMEREALVAAMSANVQVVFAQATTSETVAGIMWYTAARAFACSLAQRFSLTVETVAGVIAALSPNCSWARNKIDTITVCEAFLAGAPFDAVKVSTYNNNKKKAFAILNAAGTKEYRAAFRDAVFGFLGGDKTTAFARNIAYPCADAVTVDFHAASVARGRRITTAHSKGLSSKQYELIADAYRHAAGQVGLQPYELQAVVWLVWRRLHNVHVHYG